MNPVCLEAHRARSHTEEPIWPAPAGAIRVPQGPHVHGLRGDAYQPLGREQLLELRQSLPAAGMVQQQYLPHEPVASRGVSQGKGRAPLLTRLLFVCSIARSIPQRCSKPLPISANGGHHRRCATKSFPNTAVWSAFVRKRRYFDTLIRHANLCPSCSALPYFVSCCTKTNRSPTRQETPTIRSSSRIRRRRWCVFMCLTCGAPAYVQVLCAHDA